MKHNTTARWLTGAAVVASLALPLPSEAQASTAAHHGGARPASSSVAVGPQYDTTHVYVTPGSVNAFVSSWEATFGGTNTTQVTVDVTPTPSETTSELVLSPVGTLSVFDFQTPVPYPFGAERTGWLTTDLDKAVSKAHASGADVTVTPFKDPIGRDAVIQFPGGVNTQLYWHTTAPSYAPLATVPDNRVYVSADAVGPFLRSYLAFTCGRVVSDDRSADAAAIGLPGQTYRQVDTTSPFGKTVVIVTDGHLPYPFGRETTGYRVSSLPATLARAEAHGATVLWGPTRTHREDSALVRFPGGYVAEIHDGGSS